MSPGEWRAARVCLNGHLVSNDDEPGTSPPTGFCTVCGGRVIAACEYCQEPLRGRYRPQPGEVFTSAWQRPRYCHACGRAHPWQTALLSAAKQLVDEAGGLQADERETMVRSIEAVARDAAGLELAAARLRRLLEKLDADDRRFVRRTIESVSGDEARRLVLD